MCTGAELDDWLARGGRHFGETFFRTSHAIHQQRLCGVLALRLPVHVFSPQASLRRVLARNADTTLRIVPASHREEYDAMFEAHRARFGPPVPDSLRDFLHDAPGRLPCPALAFEVRVENRLKAVSFLALGDRSTSAIYGMYDPAETRRSLGLLTMLREVEFTRLSGREYYYSGYAYSMPSPYDYKFRFRGLEVFDWRDIWRPVEPRETWSFPIPVSGTR